MLIDTRTARPNGGERVALDIKVINALGLSHMLQTLQGPVKAAETHREGVMQHMDTCARCADKGERYEPLVFTSQGGVERHAETMFTQIAQAVAHAEGVGAATVKAEMFEAISVSIVGSVAKSVMRRAKGAPVGFEPAGLDRWRTEAHGLEDEA